MNAAEIFTDIYYKNLFGGVDSVSGPGSDRFQTRVIVSTLPQLCHEFGVSTILDIPCGDFYWMRTVNLKGIQYMGADIVEDLIFKNKIHENDNVTFCRLNLISDRLPRVDLVLCRDCLVHFSYQDAFQAIKNICESRSTYLLTTTFTNREFNVAIKTGEWWPINLEIPPFDFPNPEWLIIEECTEVNGEYRDKSLGLWRISRLAK